MKNLVAWKEEPEMESSVENVEMEVHTGMGSEEQHSDEVEKDDESE